MGGAYKALTHKVKFLWRPSSVQILPVLQTPTLTSHVLISTPSSPLYSHLKAKEPFCKFWNGSIWITTNLLSVFR